MYGGLFWLKFHLELTLNDNATAVFTFFFLNKPFSQNMQSNAPGNHARSHSENISSKFTRSFYLLLVRPKSPLWTLMVRYRMQTASIFFCKCLVFRGFKHRTASLAHLKAYLSVIQDFSLGWVGFEAQDSFSFVKLVFNSPRIHLFMATCERESIDRIPKTY